MPTSRHVQTSFTAGEFDPLLWSREDVSFFYNSARIIENAIPLPQGGARRREGWVFRGLQRGPISSVSFGGASVTAPNGGTVASATDGNSATTFQTTTNISTATSYVVIDIDFTTATRVSVWDFDGLRVTALASGVGSIEAVVEKSDNGSDYTEAASLLVGDIAYNRRYAKAPDTDLGEARYWRLRLVNGGGDDFGTAKAEFTDMLAWSEAGYSNAGTVGDFSLHRLTSSISDEYFLIATAGNIDVFRTSTGAWVASVAIPHADSEVAAIKSAPNLDTMLLYHQEHPVQFVQRLAGDANWRSGEAEFDSVVEFAFQDADVSGGVNEKHYLNFTGMASGDDVTLEFFGQITSQINWSTTASTNAAAVKAAIEALDDFDLVSVSVTGSGVDANLTIEYQGIWAKSSVPIVIVDILTGTGSVTISRTQYGRPDKDQLWSATRGYPSCGTFYQGRHWMGGFKARPDILVGSRAGALFDFKQDVEPVAGSPIVVAPNIDDQVSIQNIYPGRHLQIFTSSAEMYVPDEPITPDNIALKVTSRHGSSASVQPVDIQGGTLFIDRNGRALREYLFTDAEQSYSADPVSLLAGHLVASPRSLVLRRQLDIDEPTILLLANTGVDRNGDPVPASMCVIDRAQQVTGFCRVNTNGTPVGFATSQGGDAFAMVKRDLAGSEWHFFEQFDEDHMSDCSVMISGSGSTVDVSAYPWLEGEEVYVHVDGLAAGEFTVSSGAIDLGDYEYTLEVEVGLRMVPRIVMHPYKGKGEVSPTMQKMRMFRLLLQLERTGTVAITAHDGGTVKEVSLRNWDSGVYDRTFEETLFTGAKRVSGLGAWQIEPTIEITQLTPMPFLLRSITYDVRF